MKGLTMNNLTLYKLIQWRKRLERKGWYNASRFPVPSKGWIEYHAVWQGKLMSGRCPVTGMSDEWMEPGTPGYLLLRMQDVIEAVWRPTRIGVPVRSCARWG
ncbi:MAG: hypothetical protein ACRC3F_08910 [Billgrantia desiderata]